MSPTLRPFVLLVLACVIAGAFVSATSASAADFHVFGRIGTSSGLGVDGANMGIEGRARSGRFIVCTVATQGQKVSGKSALFWGSSLEYRRERGGFLYGFRGNYVRQETESWSKDGFFGTVRVGYAVRPDINLLLNVNAPDSTENETWGVGVSVEALRSKFGLVADLERVFFRPSPGASYTSGNRMSVGLGMKF